jgi:SAM-dependent methyltransferase
MASEDDVEPPALGAIEFGDLRRVTPVSRAFGFERGRPVDRYYIERFLTGAAADITGRVVEVGDDTYTRQFGRRMSRSDVLDLPRNAGRATILADLTAADHIPTASFDCFILTQTLQYVYDLPAAAATLHRVIKPGGVLLASFPVISQICRYDMDRWGDYWRFTTASAGRLLADVFGPERVDVTGHGNVLAALCFLHGLSAEELEPAELDYHDPDYEIVVTARAVKEARP